MSKLAFFGGPKAVQQNPGDMFTWPIITKEDEEAALDVLRGGKMSGTDITKQFETEFAAWQGAKYALGFNNGTAAIHAGLYACGVGIGDEIICPSVTYWASAAPVFSLGGTVVFADINPKTLCIEPNDIERHISPRTKVIVVVHYLGYPADMDPIMAIAKKHGIKVLEDVSHAQGGLYKGRKVGTIGDVGAMSLMSGKSLAVGEAGMLVTNDRYIYEHALVLGHYERYKANELESEDLKPFAGLPLGGYKYRMHQMSSAVGRVQLKHYDERCAEIRKAMNYFWDLLEGVPGIEAHRTPKDSDSNMAGWYAARGIYHPEQLGGLSVTRFCKAVSAEGVPVSPGANRTLHLAPLFNTADVYRHGKPTVIVNSDRDHRQPEGSLPVSEITQYRTFAIPWFKHYRPEVIKEYADGIRKVCESYQELLAGDEGDKGANLGGYHFFSHSS